MANHRADKRARSHASRVQPSVPTGSHAGTRRRNPLPGLPSAPTLGGAAALVVAAAGAIALAQPPHPAAVATDSLQPLSASSSAANGAIGSSLAAKSRKLAVSRDSARTALQDAASQKLQAVAESQAKARNAALQKLAASAEKHANAMAKNAWQLPIPAGTYHLTGRFGQSSGLWAHTHTGLDFATASGSPIHAVANGVVTETGYAGAYGNRTIITLQDGTELWYCHQTTIGVAVGDQVVGGQVIGLVGSTGNATGPHLHLEVRPGAGDPVDPETALRVHGLTP